MIKIVVSKFMRDSNKSMSLRFVNVELMRFVSLAKAEYFVTTSFGSGVLPYFKFVEVLK